jgi:hypothetical protein
MQTSDSIQLGLLVITIIGLSWTIISNRQQLHLFNKQLRLNFFADYTKRYQEIILNFPEEINEPDFDFARLTPKARSKTLRYMRVYFDLCSEEFDLWNAGYLDSRIWNNWREGIEFTCSKKAFKDAWGIIKLDTKYYPQFGKWIEEMINS